CVRHAASVRPEPGSNSPIEKLEIALIKIPIEPRYTARPAFGKTFKIDPLPYGTQRKVYL
ncbi:MAG: hypothetical protein WEE89_02935, partial [Gemmatimonadota bacterium]